MKKTAGQKTGQAPGLDWGDYLDALVAERGTLSAVAWKLIEHGDDVANIERALRRLRQKGHSDGGTWGRRLLHVFGMPNEIAERLRWMGLYHSPFNDLPLPLCVDQLRIWDRPPASDSRARVWLQLGFASCALRQRAFDEAAARLQLAEAASPPDDARVEIALVRGYQLSRAGDEAAVARQLDAAEQLLDESSLTPIDRACFRARLVDQRAFRLNRREQFAAALALYRSLPAADEHPFASYRRDAGLAYGHFRLGAINEALICAHRASQHAGDGGYTRLRVMALILLARIDPGGDFVARAQAIAERLHDDELLLRVTRARR